MWDEITYLFPNLNDAAVEEVWDWMRNFIQRLTGRVIIYARSEVNPC